MYPWNLFGVARAFTPKLVSIKPEWKVYSRVPVCRVEELGPSRSLGYRQKPL